MNYRLLLYLILLLFLITRLYKITEVPPSLYWDEASIGYNAYSVLKTGKDEWGEFLPLHFRAFGEFKLPVYIYTVSLFQIFLGLSELSVRLPAVFYSLGSIILIYLLTKQITKSEIAALFAAFYLVISPWFYLFSRTGFEATAGVMFYLLGIYLSLNFDRNRLILLFSAISFIASMYSYNSFRIVVPLTVILLGGYFFLTQQREFKKRILILCTSVLLLLISFIPMVRLFTADAGATRFQAVGAFVEGRGESPVITFIKNYASHFDYGFLFAKGDTQLRHHIPGVGQLYMLDFPLILMGILLIVRKRLSLWTLPILLVALGFVPSALTKEAPHSLRSIASLPFISIVLSFGILFVYQTLQKNRLIIGTLILVYIFSFSFIFWKFLNAYPSLSSEYWQYAYKQVFTKYKNTFDAYDWIVVSDSYAQPYIYALFYQQFDPQEFRENVKYNHPSRWGISTVKSFDKFYFSSDVSKDLPKGKILVFAAPNDQLSRDAAKRDVIYHLDNSVGLYVYEISWK